MIYNLIIVFSRFPTASMCKVVVDSNILVRVVFSKFKNVPAVKVVVDSYILVPVVFSKFL